MRVELEPTLILHRRPWRDTSLIVEAFSRERGRVALMAKGARRPRSRWRAQLEPLSLTELSWTGRGELYTLTDLEFVRQYQLSDKTLLSGLYAAELLMRLTARDDPCPTVYDAMTHMLSALHNGAPAIVGLRFFERDLLEALGYGLNLLRQESGEPVRAEAEYRYLASAGLRPRGQLREGVPVAGRTLLGLFHGRLPDREAVHQARDLLQAALAPHLGNRPLKSVQTLQAMQQVAAGGAQASTAPSNMRR